MSDIKPSTGYSAKETEQKWYAHWMSQNYFRSTPDEREPYTIVIPPPNVTGVLHMGHMLNNTIQDILIRRARMQGKNACWVPGTDHASIATEAKVVKLLREKGIKKGDIGREEFLKHAFEWKEKYGGIILEQLKLLGCSCDWERTRFTMEPKLSAAVVTVFVDLFKKGKLYRGVRMTNWDSEAKTVLSNEEVIFGEENNKMYYVKYQIEGGSPDEYLTVATVRPETIMGDVAVCVHPDDLRYTHLHGKRCIVPIVNRPVPIICDTYIDMEFGTGCLKVTPAHDPNDYEIGQKFNLPVIDCFNDDGTISAEAQYFVGEDRFAVRKKMEAYLTEINALVETKDYRNRVGRSERTNVVVEPRLKLQWWLKMDELSATALAAVENDEVRFHPENFKNMYRSWMTNTRDWCISRQLWWGQQIPAWYLSGQEGDANGLAFVAETQEEALAQARQQTGNPNLQLSDLTRDEDVVDTWFSSWLWPISVFDGFENQEELKYYYPTNTLVTGWDIMFFWVARMIMAGYEWAPALMPEKPKFPFRDVYFTGMVRDKQRRKMSKSLGNSPEALELIEKYGADGVRFGMLFSSPAGGDLVFDAPFDPKTKEVLNTSDLCDQGRNFCNKLYNAQRLIQGWPVNADADQPVAAQLAAKWFGQELERTAAEVNTMLDAFDLSGALKSLYNFIWDDYCSWYLEMVKPEYGQPIDAATLETTIGFFEKLMRLLHPFMPFVSEEMWHNLRTRAAGDDVCVAQWLEGSSNWDKDFLYKMEMMKAVVTGSREARNANQLKPREVLPLFVKDTPQSRDFYLEDGIREAIMRLACLDNLDFSTEELEGATFLAGTEQYTLHFKKEINVEEERARLQKELDYALGFVKSIEGKLSNERFVGSAPAAVVEAERKKMADGQAKVALLQESLSKL